MDKTKDNNTICRENNTQNEIKYIKNKLTTCLKWHTLVSNYSEAYFGFDGPLLCDISSGISRYLFPFQLRIGG